MEKSPGVQRRLETFNGVGTVTGREAAVRRGEAEVCGDLLGRRRRWKCGAGEMASEPRSAAPDGEKDGAGDFYGPCLEGNELHLGCVQNARIFPANCDS